VVVNDVIPRLFFGDPEGDYISWDGENGLTVAGDVRLPGGLISNDDSGSEIVRNDTDQTGGGNGTWTTLHSFSVYGTGTIAVRVNARTNFGGVYTAATNGSLRLLRNGTTVVAGPTGAGASLSSSYAELAWTGITVTDLSDTFEVQAQAGSETQEFPFPDTQYPTVTVDWVSVRARWQLGSFF
jgi:hypothetical protein